MNTILRVAAYARVSTDRDDQANSFHTQVAYFTDYIDRQENWKLVKVYHDEGVTGTTTRNRIGFNTMIDDVLSGEIDFIITKEVSRFARNTVDTLRITRKLKTLGVGVFFMLDNINTLDKDGELRLTLMASLAQEESRKTSERIKWGQKRQMEKGVVFGRSLLGYRVKKGKLYLVEDEAEIVRLIFHKYLNEGKGAHTIARELKEKGIKPYDPDGKSKNKNNWSNTAILRILRNEKYVGDLCQKKTYTPDYLDHKKCYNHGQVEMIYIKDHHPEIAIITRDMWDATQIELTRRSTPSKQTRKYSNRHWASGKIVCGVCGEKFVSKIKKTTVGISRSWCCLNHVKATVSRTNECTMSEWANDKSLKYIVLYILQFLVDSKDALKKELYLELKALFENNDRNPIEETKYKIGCLEENKLKLIDIRLTGEISKEDFLIKKEQIESKILSLTKELKRSKKELSIKLTKNNCLTQSIDETNRILEFGDISFDTLIGALIQNITVFEGHIVVVKIHHISPVFQVKYRSYGKLDNYQTEILEFKIC